MSSDSQSSKPGGAQADLSGRQFGDYRLLRRLGRGAMAEVYLAQQDSLNRRVAIKVLRQDLAEDATYIARFQREAQAAAALTHANIVQIHEVACIDRTHLIAQEYVEGQNLRVWLARNGPPEAALALRIMRQVASALAKAASCDVVHRDIKPENIMLTPSGEVKVADFGLARMPRTNDALELTQVGVTLGTPLYMSPEQVEGRSLDPRSDLYSFGVTCYHMLAGAPPFSGETALSVAVQHLNSEPAPLNSIRPDLPEELCQVVQRMLAKRPDDRFASPADLLAVLYRIEAEVLGQPIPSEATLPVSPTLHGPGSTEATQRLATAMHAAPPARGSWSRATWAATLAALLVAGGGAGWLAMREKPLLAESQTPLAAVPRQASALRQWYYASRVGTEPAWKAVVEYFPEKEYLANRARQQLARIYLRQGRYDAAMEIFQQFAALDEAERELRAFGLAGVCGVLTLQDRNDEAAAALDRLWPIRDQLRDAQLRQFVDHAIRKIRSETGPQSAQDWQQWLEEQFEEDTQ
jgi:serine/threonine-protein kinase